MRVKQSREAIAARARLVAENEKADRAREAAKVSKATKPSDRQTSKNAPKTPSKPGPDSNKRPALQKVTLSADTALQLDVAIRQRRHHRQKPGMRIMLDLRIRALQAGRRVPQGALIHGESGLRNCTDAETKVSSPATHNPIKETPNLTKPL